VQPGVETLCGTLCNDCICSMNKPFTVSRFTLLLLAIPLEKCSFINFAAVLMIAVKLVLILLFFLFRVLEGSGGMLTHRSLCCYN
jgi:hypothetical protein